MHRKKSVSSVLWRRGRRFVFGLLFVPAASRTPDRKNEEERDRRHDADEEDSGTDPEEGLRPPARRGPGRLTGSHIARGGVEDPHVAASIRGINRRTLIAATRRNLV